MTPEGGEVDGTLMDLDDDFDVPQPQLGDRLFAAIACGHGHLEVKARARGTLSRSTMPCREALNDANLNYLAQKWVEWCR